MGSAVAPTISPAAYASSARIRLPPSSTAYRIACESATGIRSAAGSTRASTSSTRRWRSLHQTAHARSGFIARHARFRSLERLQQSPFIHLHLLLRVLERRLAILEELGTAL